MFIHGGYWRSLDPSQFSHMARGLNAHGVAVAVAGYDLCPQVTIPDIIEEIRQALLFLWERTGQRVMVYGHSAGGHLAAAMVATDWHGLYPKMPADLVPAAYSISGVFDLTPLLAVSMNAGLAAHARRRVRGLAAVLAGAQGPRLRCRGGRARIRANSCARAASSRTPGARPARETRYQEIAGTNHFTVLDASPIRKARWSPASPSLPAAPS